MGFSRGLANIATFGAVGRVDKAGRLYQDLVDTHNHIVNEIQKAKTEVKELAKDEKEWKRFKRKNKHMLEELYHHDTNLSETQKQALKTLKKDLDLSHDFKGLVQVLGDDITSFPDTTSDNIAITAGTLILNIIPGFGALGAHLMANDQIEELEALSNSVEREITRIKPIYQQMIKLRNELKLRSKAFLAIREMANTYVLPKKKRFFFF